MDPRARRLAIREHLNRARAAVDRGDRIAALDAINAALLLDPDYLAAQTLKERVERSVDVRAEFNPGRTAGLAGDVGPKASATVKPSTASPGNSLEAASQAVVSPEGWARFESRARARRIEKRVAAAQAAIARGRFAEAKAIVDEIREMDPAHPDLISLAIELDAAVHSRPTWTWRIGPAAAAIVVFGALLFGARYLEMAPIDRTASVDSIARENASPPAATPAPGPSTTPAPAPAPPADLEPSASPSTATGSTSELTTADTTTSAAQFVSPSIQVPTTGALSTSGTDAAPITGSGPASSPSPSDARASGSENIASPGQTASASGSTAAAAARELERTEPAPRTFSTADSVSTDAAARANLDPPTARTDDSNPTSELPSLTARAAAAPPAPVVETPRSPATAPVVDLERTDPPVRRAVLPDSLSNAAASSSLSASAANVPVVRDEDLVRETLQVYRRAYESLDARSARAVWPRVDGAALQRAFDGLESQRLMFDSCQVQVRGNSGSAVCRGTTRYVPKVGSRDPRVEPRTWTFALHKSGDDWQIDSARAER